MVETDEELLSQVFTWRGKTLTVKQWATHLGIPNAWMSARVRRFRVEGDSPPWCMFVRDGEYPLAIRRGIQEKKIAEMENL